MATERYFICVECHRRAYKARLFQTLRELSRGMTTCEACGGTMALHLVFKFGLDAGGADCKVLDVFLPADKDLDAWKREDGKWVTFFPFLVVMEYTDKRGQAFWLSYWHTVEGDASKQTKYGQWAPFLNGYLLKSLLAQARG